MADNPYIGLRNLALQTTDAMLKIDGLRPDDCYSLLMETGLREGSATLVCFLTGDASRFCSSGGGIIGAGQKLVVVADAAKRFVTMGTKFVPEMQQTEHSPLPAQDMTLFYALTGRARYSFGAPQVQLGNNHSVLSPLFHAGHEVISALRQFAPR